MRADAKVIEYLNQALKHELTAVNQYWLHYRILDNWGYKALAKTWREESIEEMRHADTLTATANLAAVLWRQGDQEEAYALQQHVVELHRRAHGESELTQAAAEILAAMERGTGW